MELQEKNDDLNVSFLQVLAILSFEKENHKALKEINFLEKLETNKLFDKIFIHFDDVTNSYVGDIFDKKRTQKKSMLKKDGRQEILDAFKEGDMMQTNEKKSKKRQIEKEKINELARAISIILANLSSEEDFVKSLLGISKWKGKDKKITSNDHFAIGSLNQMTSLNRQRIDSQDRKQEESKFDESDILQDQSKDQIEQTQLIEHEEYDDNKLIDIPEVKRITKLLNLMSHENSFISEQISILLANVSNSQYFRHIFITDRCMKALIKILRFDRKQKPTEVTLLAILIGVLNLSSLKDVVKGIENMRFLQCLEDIIKNDQLPYVTKSIALLAISNLYTLSKNIQQQTSADNKELSETKEFAFSMLQHWKQIHEEQQENIEVVKNLVYSSLILFYNLILRKNNHKDTIRKLVVIITDHVLGFKDHQIVSIVLELVTLFTREKETAQLIFKNKSLLNYTFDQLKTQQLDTLKLSSLALSRLAARLDEYNSEYFIQNLKEFNYIDIVVENISKHSDDHMNIILKYFLNFLENISSFKKTRDELDCSKLYDAAVQLYTEKISLENKVSLINIIFNLNFNLLEPRELSKDFLKQLYKTYKDESLKKDEKIQRKIIVLIVSASAKDENHKAIIKCGFYTQFKRNINDLYDKLIEANEEVELFGLVNIALNKKYMHLIYQDLKKIYKLALRNNKIDFKTKVDLFTECSKFLSKISTTSHDKGQAPSNEKDISEMIDHCLKALLFSLIQLIQLLDQQQYPMFKYLLNAILESTKNLKNVINYLSQLIYSIQQY